MKLRIGNYSLESDGICITLFAIKTHKKGDNIGKEFQTLIGHYPNLEQGLHRLLEERMAEEARQSIKGLLLKIEATKQQILEVLVDGNLRSWGAEA